MQIMQMKFVGFMSKYQLDCSVVNMRHFVELHLLTSRKGL